ncbi:MAG: DUF2809 domain-containing protein [Clostridia bacterium]|nr:DUF2809 domain-containing protein [Clostridia bacterium]
MSANLKTRLCYAGGISILIAAGLFSRRTAIVPAFFGDALWAMVVYCCWRIVLVKKAHVIAAVAALATSFAVEFSQLLSFPWLVRFRSTLIGHLLLGQGFLWIDLLAYTLGITVIFLCTFTLFRKKASRREE